MLKQKEKADQVRRIAEEETGWLLSIDSKVVSGKRNLQGRTVKGLLGHLIDSASNNHQRMVRLQYEKKLVFPDYTANNDLWIGIQHYDTALWEDVVMLWKYYNLHLARIMETADTACMNNVWHDEEGRGVTLRQMIEGYVDHLRLHLQEIRELSWE